MASNDMNSWDDNPDEQLRQHWQQTFANFRVEASASLSNRILNALPARRRRAYRLAGVLVLMSVAVISPLRLGEDLDSDRNLTTVGHTSPTQPLHDSRTRRSESVGGRLTSAPVRVSRPDEFTIHRQPMAKQPAGTDGIAASRMDISFNNTTTRKPSSTAPTRLRSRTSPRLRATTAAVNQLYATSGHSVDNRLAVQLAGSDVRVDSDFVADTTTRAVRATTGSPCQPHQSSDVLFSDNRVPMVWMRLKPVGIWPLSSRLSPLPGELPITNVSPSQPVEAVVVHRRLLWFAEVVPLNSFQWMSVSPAATAYLSQIKAPAAFSTLGYQVNGGIRWQHWQAHLSVGQFQRWAYYTVNENRYRVEPRPDNPNQLVRETYAVTENVSVPMMGIGLSQERFLDRGRYAVNLGGQVWYLPTGQQVMSSVQGGVGRRLAVSRSAELQVGLRAEYGLNRLLSDQQQLAIHPLLIGLGFRIQPRPVH